LKKVFAFVIIIPSAILLAYLFNYFFLDLSTRSTIERGLLLFFLTCPLIFVFYMLWLDGVKFDAIRNLKISLNWNSVRDNSAGILLALSFFVIYLNFGIKLNNFGLGQVDNLLDADISSWMRRFSAPHIKDFPMRGPHPFAYFIFRPFGLSLNVLTHDPTLSAILLNTLAGGICVFLAWLFLKRQFQNKTYAFLMAGLLGVSASHFFFGSVIETYIFSALALILFFLLLQSDSTSLMLLAASSALTFGITITNFMQNLIGFVSARPRLRDIIRFAGWAVSISLILSFIHAAVYPASKLFFLLQEQQGEQSFFLQISIWPRWRIIGRIIYLVRTILMNTIVAPNVFILRQEVGSYIPEYHFWKLTPGTFHQAGYDALGKILVFIWMLILLTSVVVFFWNLIRTRKTDLSLPLALCILFNFVLHIDYGQELFLYSPDWAYALVFFAAFGLAPFAKNRFFQAGLLVFLILLGNHRRVDKSIYGIDT